MTIVCPAPPTSNSCAILVHLVVECGIHGQQKYQSCKMAMLLWYRSRDNICTIFRCKHLLETGISSLNSLLNSKESCIDVFRSWSCSQSTRQRICRRPVSLTLNLHWNSQFNVCGSQGYSNLTTMHNCVELSFSNNAQGCQALKSGSSFHSVIASLSHLFRHAFSRDWIAGEIAVHEDSGSINVFLSSKSQCSFGFPNQISRCTFQRNKVEFTRFTRSLDQMLRGFCKV